MRFRFEDSVLLGQKKRKSLESERKRSRVAFSVRFPHKHNTHKPRSRIRAAAERFTIRAIVTRPVLRLGSQAVSLGPGANH